MLLLKAVFFQDMADPVLRAVDEGDNEDNAECDDHAVIILRKGDGGIKG
jgi:hypothetical protein